MPRKPERKIDTDFGVALVILRHIRGMTQEELARASDLRSASISDYERGVTVPELRTLQRLLQAMDFPLSAIEATEHFVRRMRSGSPGEAFSYGEPPPASGELAAVLAEFGRVAEKLVQASLLVVSRHAAAGDEITASQAGAAGGTAGAAPAPLKTVSELWESLKNLSPQAQRKLVRADSVFRYPGLSMFLCRESIALAGRNPRRALLIAELAVEVARSIPGATRLVGYAEVHRANAFRVQGDLPAAERIFSEGEALLGAAGAGDPVDDAVIYALKASLRRSQGRLQEALELHDWALGRPGASEMRSELLASKAYTLDESGDLAGMAMVLQEAVQSLTGKEDPRLLLSIRHNLVDALSKAGHFTDAHALLPEVKRLAARVGSDLDFARLHWTEGRIEAGLGNIDGGISLLLRVRGVLVSKGIAFDTALVTMELALFYTRQGRPDTVKDIARHLTPLFQAQALPRETLAALTVFRRAAEAEKVTAELALRLLEFLRRARHNPGLPWEPDPKEC